MNTSNLNILVVDDARFSAAVVNRTLAAGGYSHVRHVHSAYEALDQHTQQAADLVVADWLMPGMDGLELTRRLRQNDEAENRYTYVLLLTAREGVNALQQAFNQGVDDFVSKSAMTEQLLHRVMAADRIIQRHNRVQTDFQRMLARNSRLQSQALVDPLTGFGNRRDALRQLDNNVRHCQRRAGATCLLLLELANYEALKTSRGEQVLQQAVLAFSRRLRQSVRPLDYLCRLSEHQFALITHQPSLAQCEPSGFRRLYEKLNHRAYQTLAGFISLEVDIAITASEGERQPEQMLERTEQEIAQSREQKGIVSA